MYYGDRVSSLEIAFGPHHYEDIPRNATVINFNLDTCTNEFQGRTEWRESYILFINSLSNLKQEKITLILLIQKMPHALSFKLLIHIL